MVLVLLSCVMGRQDYHKEELWLFTVLHDYRSASDLAFGYPGSDMVGGIAGTNVDNSQINWLLSKGLGKTLSACGRDEKMDYSEKA